MRLLVCLLVVLVGTVLGDDLSCHSNGLTVYCSVSLSSIPNEVDFIWQKQNGEGPTVTQRFNMTTNSYTFQLHRFVPITEYIILMQTETISLKTTVTTGSCGFTQLDNNPFATIAGTPTFNLIFVDIGTAYAFIDETGWVVWFYNTKGVLPAEPAQAKTQLPNYDFVLLNNGTLERVSPNITVTEIGARICNPYSVSYENHESRASRDGIHVYSLAQSIRNETLSWNNLTSVLGQNINEWDITTNSYKHIYTSFNIWNPQTDHGADSVGRLTVECLGNVSSPKVTALDWSHCNSISEGRDNNLIISSRSLSSFVSAKKDGSGVEWMVSSEIPCNYTFPNATDKFYTQHDVQQLPNGNVILIDNGGTRPAEYGEFSRAAEYEIDHVARTVSLIWEFIPYLIDGTQLICFHGGSITLLENEEHKRFASFPCDNFATSGRCTIVAYEIENDELIATIQFNHVSDANEKFIGSYRAEPWRSIAGEIKLS